MRVLHGAYKFNEGGWTYVHLEGTPEQVGFQHGYLLAREIEDNVHVYQVEAPHDYKREWSFFREAAKNILWPHLDAEYQQELKGIAAGPEGAGIDAGRVGYCGAERHIWNWGNIICHGWMRSSTGQIRRRPWRRANAARLLPRDRRPRAERS